MAVRLGEVDARALERLQSEIGEVVARELAYPPFYSFRTGTLSMRPISQAKRAEIAQFLQSVNLAPIERVDVTSPDLRRFFERLLVRYTEVNPDLRAPRLARWLPALRTRTPSLAAALQRGLVAHLAGEAPAFGTRRQAAAWAGRPGTPPEPRTAEHNTRVLQAILLAPPTPGRAQQWPQGMQDATMPVPTQSVATPNGAAAFDALGAGAQSAIFAVPGAGPELPTGPLPTQSPSVPRGAAPRELPPDLYQLYGDYLHDMQPEAAQPPAPPRHTPAPRGQVAPAASPHREDPHGDRQIFSQLRYQVEAYVRLAAQSYGIREGTGDPATVLDALRRSGLVDEADLRIAEGILALTDRITAHGQPSIEDYRQALMLYLLYHRSHLGT